MAFRPVPDSGGGDIIKFDKPGTQVTGIYVGRQDFPEGKWGPTVKHIFNTEAGIKVAFFKDDTQPGKLLAQLTAGQLVRFTFTGTKPSKNGGNPMKLYSLDIDDEYVATPADLANADDEEEEFDDTPADEIQTAAANRTPPVVNKAAVNNVFKTRGRTN